MENYGISLDPSAPGGDKSLIETLLVDEFTIHVKCVDMGRDTFGPNYIWTCNDIKIWEYKAVTRKWTCYLPHNGNGNYDFETVGYTWNPHNATSRMAQLVHDLGACYINPDELTWVYDSMTKQVSFTIAGLSQNAFSKGIVMNKCATGYANMVLPLFGTTGNTPIKDVRFMDGCPYYEDVAKEKFNTYVFDLLGL